MSLTDDQFAKILEVSSSYPRQLRHHGLESEENCRWSIRETLGLAAKIHARRAGASKAASTMAYRIVASANEEDLIASVRQGNQYLVLIGDLCDSRYYPEKSAFSEELLKVATKARDRLVVVDLAHWLDRIETELSANRSVLQEAAAV
jgi:hypothetical protein